MSKRPQTSPPPAGPGRPGAVRRGVLPETYKRPVQSPDAETVMLASVKTEADIPPDPDVTPEPAAEATPEPATDATPETEPAA